MTTFKKHKLLITGGLGNLGSWLTSYFCQQNFEVFVLASRERNLTEALNFTFIQCDITHAEEIATSLAPYQFDFVIHTASANDFFKENFVTDALLVNALGTRNLLEYFKDKSLQHFIYFSTFQVYGSREGFITEETPTLPVNDYGTTHLFAEIYVKQFHRNFQLPYTILRLTNSYGCPKDTDSSKWYLVLNDLARMAVQEKKIVLKSNGKATRDFIWMGDVCAITHALLNQPPANEIYNVAGEKTYSIRAIAEQVQQAYEEHFGEQLPIEKNKKDLIEYPDNMQVSAAKLKKKFNYETQDKFKEEAKKIFSLAGKLADS